MRESFFLWLFLAKCTLCRKKNTSKCEPFFILRYRHGQLIRIYNKLSDEDVMSLFNGQ